MQVRCASLLEGIEAPSPTLNECMLSTTDENNDCDEAVLSHNSSTKSPSFSKITGRLFIGSDNN